MPAARRLRVSTAGSSEASSSSSAVAPSSSRPSSRASASAAVNKSGTRQVGRRANVKENAEEADDSEEDEEILKPTTRRGGSGRSNSAAGAAATTTTARRKNKVVIESESESESESDEMALPATKNTNKSKTAAPARRPVKQEPVSEPESGSEDEELIRPLKNNKKAAAARVPRASNSSSSVTTARTRVPSGASSRSAASSRRSKLSPVPEPEPEPEPEEKDASGSDSDEGEDDEIAQSLIIPSSAVKKPHDTARRQAKIEEDDEEEDAEEKEEQESVDELAAPSAAQPAPAVDEAGGEDEEADQDNSSRASTPAPATPEAEDLPEPDIADPAGRQANGDAEDQQEDDGLAASLAARPILTNKPIPILQEQTGPKQRLVIHKMALVDFKSYAGRQEIGPFHKSFSSIVGPNGSGKSNTIDALLFVFGFKATKMRQGKLSELIHNSEGREDISSCSVEVWFREIIDLPGPDAYDVVPDSTLVVARTAYRNNSSIYTINNKKSTFTEVTTLLKDRGIDLDHKRFLILQGEVESIAQMKPKAPNEHEDGLLEYLEDIIGTSRYKEPIKECQEEVDKLNEERLEKTNRVKLVEREKSALEHAKKEADGYLRDLNALAHRNNELYQVYQHRYKQNIEVAQQSVEKATKELEVEKESQAGIRKEVADLEAEYGELHGTFKLTEEATNKVSKEFIQYEKEDVQLQEKRKHLVTKQKKLKKSIQDDTHARSEASSSFKNYGEDGDRFKTELAKHEVDLAREETELEKICDGLKDKTSVFSAQIDLKQADLQPWLDRLGEKKASMDLAKNQRNLLKEKAESAQKAIAEAEETMQKVQADNEEKEASMQELRAEKADIAEAAEGLKRELQQLQAQDAKLRATASSARQKVEEAKANQAASRSKGDVLTSLTKLKEQGRLAGFHGRLGNLGRIDDKYDVAVSTAAPGLDNLVCDNVEAGQACLEHLRNNNLGRATILCLNALSARNLAPIETPENVPRLFDLVTPKDQKLAPAFYQVLQNTLVAKDLTQANRIAFGGQGGKRWRVVTLDGKLIDTSGTMSGGGNRVARGAMSSKIANDEDVTPETVARLERDTTKADEALRTFSTSRQEKEDELAALQKKLPDIEMSLSKTEMAMRAGKKRLEEASKRIQELKGAASRPQADELKRIAGVEKDIEKLEGEHAKVQQEVNKINGEIKGLQDQILEVGGVRLRSQQAKVNGIKEMSDHANDQLTKAEVGRAKAEKDLAKLEKNLKMNGQAAEELDEDLAALEKAIRTNSNSLHTLRKQVETAQALLEEKSEELAAIKADLDEKQADMNKFRARETELEQELDKAKRKFLENQKALDAIEHKLSKLELHEVGDDDDEDEEDPDAPPKAAEELKTLSEEEIDDLDPEGLKAQIVLLEETIAKAKPNLAVLKEYRRREKEFLERAQDLEKITQARDAAKKQCDDMRKQRLDEFMAGFNVISMKLKEMYQMITLGGNAELELVDSLDPFSEGIIFSVMPPKKSWKNISNLSGGEKTLSSLALVFALHVFKPTPLYFMDEIDAALDFRNVSIVANYIKDSTKQAQFIIISLRNNMFELASRLVGIYKTNNCTKTISIDNSDIALIHNSSSASSKQPAPEGIPA